MMRKHCARVALIGSVASLLVLSGCDWFGKSEPAKSVPSATEVVKKGAAKDVVGASGVKIVKVTGPQDKVLVTMAGMPVITLSSFEVEFDQFVESNPQLKQLAPLIPTLKADILKELISMMVMGEVIAKDKIDQTAEYQKDMDMLLTQIKRALNRKYFGQKIKVAISDSEIRKFYEENKDSIPGLMVSPGGVRAVGIKFDNEPAANTFFEVVKGNSAQFDALAQKDGLGEKIQDFKLVNDQSLGLNAKVRSKISALNRFPSVEMVKVSGNEFWVVSATEKEEKQYRAFDEVKDFLRSDLEREKEMKVIEEAVEARKKDLGIEIDEETVKLLVPEMPEGPMELGDASDELEQDTEIVEAPARSTKAA